MNIPDLIHRIIKFDKQLKQIDDPLEPDSQVKIGLKTLRCELHNLEYKVVCPECNRDWLLIERNIRMTTPREELENRLKQEETVTISAKEYRRLQHLERKLDALEAGGVDNWEWYSDSINDHYPECWDFEE